LAVALYNHYKDLIKPVTDDEIEIEKIKYFIVGGQEHGKHTFWPNNRKIIEMSLFVLPMQL